MLQQWRWRLPHSLLDAHHVVADKSRGIHHGYLALKLIARPPLCLAESEQTQFPHDMELQISLLLFPEEFVRLLALALLKQHVIPA